MVSRNRGGARGAGSGRPGRFALPLFAAVVVLLATVPTAQASFHLIKVREVYPGGSDDSYVELQMYSPGQEFVEGHSMTLYSSAGTLTHSSSFPTPSGVSNGANQATVLIGDTAVASTFGVTPDLVDGSLSIPAAGGAACWNAGGFPADCVAWGSFSGGTAFESATNTTAGTPISAGGITNGKAIRRKITPGCATLLEVGDDSNNSAADFEEVTPAPRNNPSTITEMACNAPSATIDSGPAKPTNVTSASFTYHSTPAGASFECRLDAETFANCETSGKSFGGPLGQGSHTFQVRATNANGTGSSASYTWTIDTTAPVVEIMTHPADQSAGNSASFTYASNEIGSTFQCSLVTKGTSDSFSSCPSTGKTYPDAQHPAPLADGEWTFKVRATDKAGNQSTPEPFPLGTFEWTVDNSLADVTPPETTIASKPPDPSDSSTASFAYASNEPGSTFECKLDGSAFAGCGAGGVTYSGLGEGQHSFQVRATDASGNTDLTPAGYTFAVVLAAPSLPVATVPPARPATPPQTILSLKPASRTRDRTPTFRFRSDGAGAAFQCKVDSVPFKPCHSPFTTRSLSLGRHMVKIRAVLEGMPDLTPAVYAFKVVRRR